MKKILVLGALSLFTVMTFCDANGAYCRPRGAGWKSRPRALGGCEQSKTYEPSVGVHIIGPKWTQDGRGRHVAKIAAQTKAIESVLQGTERIDWQQTADLLGQIYYIRDWIVQLQCSSPKEIGDDYYVIAPPRAGFGDYMGARFWRDQLTYRDEEIQRIRSQLQRGEIGGTEEQLRVLGGVLDKLETALQQIRDKMPQAGDN